MQLYWKDCFPRWPGMPAILNIFGSWLPSLPPYWKRSNSNEGSQVLCLVDKSNIYPHIIYVLRYYENWSKKSCHWQSFSKMVAILKIDYGSISVLFFICIFEHNYQIWCFYLLLSIVNMKFYLKTVVTGGDFDKWPLRHFEKWPPYWKVFIPLHVLHFSGYNCTKFHVSITYHPLLMWNLISKQAVTGGHLENGIHIENLSCLRI